MERRSYPRRLVNLALRIDCRRRKHDFGVTRNVSAMGIQFHGPSPFDVGQRLAVWVYEEGCERVDAFALATVLRAERTEDGSNVVFPFVTAVLLDRPLPKRICPRP